MGNTYRGPICGGRIEPFCGSPMKKTHLRSLEGFLDSLFAKGSFRLWKRLNAGRLFEEGPFAEGPVWMVSLQRAP